jgi:hypothetical protein
MLDPIWERKSGSRRKVSKPGAKLDPSHQEVHMEFVKRNAKWAVLLVAMTLTFASCRAEQQNQIRRQVLDLANVKQYIVLYSLSGAELFRGDVDGKVTRAEGGQGDGAGGEYVYWFDSTGKYWQTSLPYVVTTDNNRTGILSTPVKR